MLSKMNACQFHVSVLQFKNIRPIHKCDFLTLESYISISWTKSAQVKKLSILPLLKYTELPQICLMN